MNPSQIFVHVSTRHPMTSFVWQLPMNSVSAKADQKHVYFMEVMCHNGVRLCACGYFGGTLGLNVRVHGGGFVATHSQIASGEFGMRFESL